MAGKTLTQFLQSEVCVGMLVRASQFEPSSFVVSKDVCERTSFVSGDVHEWIVPRFKKRSGGRRVFGLGLSFFPGQLVV